MIKFWFLIDSLEFGNLQENSSFMTFFFGMLSKGINIGYCYFVLLSVPLKLKFLNACIQKAKQMFHRNSS